MTQVEFINSGGRRKGRPVSWRARLLINADRQIKFGSMLSDPQVASMAAVLRKVLLPW